MIRRTLSAAALVGAFAWLAASGIARAQESPVPWPPLPGMAPIPPPPPNLSPGIRVPVTMPPPTSAPPGPPAPALRQSLPIPLAAPTQNPPAPSVENQGDSPAGTPSSPTGGASRIAPR